MKRICKKLFVFFSAISLCLLLVICSDLCRAKQDTVIQTAVTKNEHFGRLVPRSTSSIPIELTKESENKTQMLLSFFKTPDGQLMPLGFYAMTSDIRDVEKLKMFRKRGIYMFHKYASTQSIEDALADLAAVRKAGVGMLQNLPTRHLNTRNEQFWEKHVLALSENKQIFLWYLPEEVSMEHLDNLRKLADIVRRSDKNNRLLATYLSNPNSEYLKKATKIPDVVIFGAYPSLYSIRPRIDIKRRLERVQENGALVVIAALEALKGKYNWTRPKDIRCDAYLALISGAKGIMWYSFNQAKQRPELLEAIMDVATELNGPDHLGEVILLGREPDYLSCRLLKGQKFSPPASAYENKNTKISKCYDSIQWIGREYKGYLYVFVVNTAQIAGTADDGGQDYRAEIQFGPVKTKSFEVDVISEARMLSLSNGYFIDRMKPLEVHIYKVTLSEN